jgi:hypothetical protein
MRSIQFTLLAATTAVLAGCATNPIPNPEPAWSQATGQIQSTGGKTVIVGEIVIRYDRENFLAEITKGPALPLLRIYAKGADAETVVARGALARGTWSGPPDKAPVALQAWAALPEAFHQARARGDISSITLQRDGEKIVCRLQK